MQILLTILTNFGCYFWFCFFYKKKLRIGIGGEKEEQ